MPSRVLANLRLTRFCFLRDSPSDSDEDDVEDDVTDDEDEDEEVEDDDEDDSDEVDGVGDASTWGEALRGGVVGMWVCSAHVLSAWLIGS